MAKKKYTKEEAKEYLKQNGKFAPGWARCMDCRCTGQGECAGQTLKSIQLWYEHDIYG